MQRLTAILPQDTMPVRSKLSVLLWLGFDHDQTAIIGHIIHEEGFIYSFHYIFFSDGVFVAVAVAVVVVVVVIVVVVGVVTLL